MNRKVVILITAGVLAVLLGGYFWISSLTKDGEDATPTPVPAQNQDTETATDSSQTSPTPTEPQPQDVVINSKKLANNYFVFEKSEYDKAKAANRPVLLFFYANWCPTCARQEPINVRTFNSLGTSNLIAFRVNYNDNETSKEEDDLAKEFGITYQHNFRILDKTGKLIDSFNGDTSESTLKEKISKVN